jgi:hypothetical protein
MKRRDFVGVSVAALATTMAGTQASAAGKVLVIYVGGWD